MKRLVLFLLLFIGCGKEPTKPQVCEVNSHKVIGIVRNAAGDSVGYFVVITPPRCY